MNNLIFEFRHDLLEDAQFEVPLVFVNRKARDIGIAWVPDQGIGIRICKNRQYPVFVDNFNRISLNSLSTFESDLTRITVPEALLRSKITTLSEMFQYFFNLKVLSIIVDAQPDLQSADNDIKYSGCESSRAHKEVRSF